MSYVFVPPAQSSEPNLEFYSTLLTSYFPMYMHQADYLAATGQPAPQFNFNQPSKYWFDPGAVQVLAGGPYSGPGFQYKDPSSGAEMVLYVAAPNSAQAAPIALSLTTAAVVNIPPDGYTGAQGIGVQPPMRPLFPNEHFFKAPLTTQVQVQRIDLIPPTPPAPTSTDDQILALLVKVAAVLGIQS
jgi:hypothetical protein